VLAQDRSKQMVGVQVQFRIGLSRAHFRRQRALRAVDGVDQRLELARSVGGGMGARDVAGIAVEARAGID
jgi:hypothetical protein